MKIKEKLWNEPERTHRANAQFPRNLLIINKMQGILGCLDLSHLYSIGYGDFAVASPEFCPNDTDLRSYADMIRRVALQGVVCHAYDLENSPPEKSALNHAQILLKDARPTNAVRCLS